MFYSDLGKKVKDYFKNDTYAVGRTAKVEVKNETTQWSLENKLTNDGKVQSELKATHNFNQDSLTLTTSNKENPKFEWKTQRVFASEIKSSVKDPVFEIEFKKSAGKINTLLSLNYNWADETSGSKLESTYEGINNLVVGFSASIIREKAGGIHTKDCDVGLKYNLTKDRAFILTTGKFFNTFNVGSMFRVRDNAVGYGQLELNKNNPSAFAWNVGVDHTLTDTSHTQFVYRSDNVANVLYNIDFPQSKTNASFVCNYDFKKQFNERASFEYKFNFSL